LDGFCGVLVELLGVGEGYVLLETAAGTGNRLLRFASESPDLAYALFEAELGSPG
jgi:ubiquinone/menaquinone biosynthesis C-methylase UbiE